MKTMKKKTTHTNSTKLHHVLPLGDSTIIALSNGKVEMALTEYSDKQLTGEAFTQEEKRLLKEHHISLDKDGNFFVPLHSFVVQNAGKTYLVDTGSGGLIPPMGSNGFLIEALAEAQIKPEDIDAIIMTHLHPDHCAGLLTSAGEKQFPNATLHVCDLEWEYWNNATAEAETPEDLRGWFTTAQEQVKPYKSVMKLFSATEQTLFPGISTLPLPGHTPGHTGFLIEESAGVNGLLIWGDILHSQTLECPHPEWALQFDVDTDKAIQTRIDIMQHLAKSGTLVAGMHVDFPGYGHVKAKGKAYEMIQAE